MEWFSEHAWEAWLGASLILGLAELVSMDLVLAMFAVGALAGMIAAVAGAAVLVQAAAAIIVSVAMLALVRPSVLKRLHSGPELKLGAAKLVGMEALALTDISGHAPGRIKVDGEDWAAKLLDETMTVTAGETVDVIRIEGATAIVYPIPRLES